jgi:hypothetical protein
MNRRNRYRKLFEAALILAPLVFCGTTAAAQSTEKFYYSVGPGSIQSSPPAEGFVIEVDANLAAQIETILGKKSSPGFSGTVAAGSVDYNRNYYAPGQPVWNWHVASVNAIFDFAQTLFPACECPFLIAKPSEIAADPAKWIRDNGPLYTPIRFSIQGRVDPTKRGGVANVSNRGVTGQGDRKLITGLIVAGGTPRNIVIRALGPSLAAAGIREVAANPKLEVYHDTTRIAVNADWQDDPRAHSLASSLPSLVPSNDKEAALWLTLLPGTYTIQATNEAGTEGIILVEAYDVDNGAP